MFSAINVDEFDMWYVVRYFFLILLSSLVFAAQAFAMNGRTTYQAKIAKPDGYPLESVSVNFRFSVLDESGTCILYIEDYAAVNMKNTGGLVSFSLGGGTRAFPVSGTSQTFQDIFDNSSSLNCQDSTIYNPLTHHARRVVMQFNEGAGWQTLPSMRINSVPYSMYAGTAANAKTLNNKTDSSFVEYSTLAALNCQPNEAINFNGVSFNCLPSSVTSLGVSGSVLTMGGTASSPVITMTAATISSDGYITSLDYAEFKAKIDSNPAAISNVLGFTPVSGSAVNSQIQSSLLGGDVSGTIASTVVESVGGKTAVQISTSVDQTLSATATNIPNTIIKRDASAGAGFNYLNVFKPGTAFAVRLEAPNSLAANYTLTLPSGSGSGGQVLSTDGSGNLSWVNQTAAPTSASIIATLGYTPSDRAQNLSDLTNVATARSNLGLGPLATASALTVSDVITALGYTPASATASTQWSTVGSAIHYSSGNVGIGTATPAARLDVQGQVKTSMGTPLVNPASNNVDFATGNTQYVTFSACPGNALTVNLFSMYDGSSYSIVVVAPNGCLVDFTGISHAIGGSGGSAVTAFKYPAGQKFSSTGHPMVYSFLRANNFVFVAQVVDFQ